MSGLWFDACWIVGGTLAALVLYQGVSAGWFTVTRRPTRSFWIDDHPCPAGVEDCFICQNMREQHLKKEAEERERLKAAAIWRGYKRL